MTSDAGLIAPCGMNCALCLGYQRTKNHCPGCHGDDIIKQVSCRRCTIKSCELRLATVSGFCYECPKFPCRRLKDLDKRYRTKYGMSMLDNLAFIRDKGLGAFVEKESERWRCPVCGDTVCVHRRLCPGCGEPRKDLGT